MILHTLSGLRDPEALLRPSGNCRATPFEVATTHWRIPAIYDGFNITGIKGNARSIMRWSECSNVSIVSSTRPDLADHPGNNGQIHRNNTCLYSFIFITEQVIIRVVQWALVTAQDQQWSDGLSAWSVIILCIPVRGGSMLLPAG